MNEKWFNMQARQLADLLMQALHVACSINRDYYLWGCIEKTIKGLNIPDQKCIRCGATMDYWNWALRQGMCDACIKEMEAEDREEA